MLFSNTRFTQLYHLCCNTQAYMMSSLIKGPQIVKGSPDGHATGMPLNNANKTVWLCGLTNLAILAV